MMKIQSLPMAASLAVCVVTVTQVGVAESTVSSLGIFNRSTSISADGAVIVGSGNGGVFRWTSLGGIVVLGGSANGLPTVSEDGSTIIASALDGDTGYEMAAIWQGGTQWQTLGGIPGGGPSDGGLSSGWGCSADGSVVVGLGWINAGMAHGFRWEQFTGMIDLCPSQTDRSCRANAVSGNGLRAVGWAEGHTGGWNGVYWEDGEQVAITTAAGAPVGDANAVTPDGSIIVGAHLNGQAWRWTQESGAVGIGVLDGFNFSGYAFDVTADGNTIVGTCGFGWDRDAFIWTSETGMVKLDTVLADQGVDMSEWDLGTADGISDDGTVITGWGFGPDGIEGWVVHLDPDPTGDINGDGRVGVADLLIIIDMWGPCPDPCPADIDGNGRVGVTDLLIVIEQWG